MLDMVVETSDARQSEYYTGDRKFVQLLFLRSRKKMRNRENG